MLPLAGKLARKRHFKWKSASVPEKKIMITRKIA
jgi:hypothetical protein